MPVATTQAELPRYKCHKEVWALKIRHFTANPNGSIDLFFEDDRYAPINIKQDEGWRERFGYVDHDGDLGYYVVYADGHISWSPSKAFEDGYTRI